MEDTLSTQKLSLDPKANTKRLVLTSVASNYDIYNFNAPLMNRAKLFLHMLQSQQGLGWDEELTGEQMSEWKKICSQVNDSTLLKFKRCVGKRTDQYNFVLLLIVLSKFMAVFCILLMYP